MSYVYLSQNCNKAAADAIGARLAGKVVRVYSGPHPASADDPLGGSNVLLSEHPLSNPAVGAADNTGKITFNAITSDTNGNADGTPSFARIEDQVTGAVEMQFDVGASGTVMIINPALITLGGTVTISSGYFQHHNGV